MCDTFQPAGALTAPSRMLPLPLPLPPLPSSGRAAAAAKACGPAPTKPQARRRSSVNGKSGLRASLPTDIAPGVWPVRKKRARRRASAS